MNKTRVKAKLKNSIICLLFAIFSVSLFFVGKAAAKYTETDSFPLNLDVRASFRMKYNANGGTIVYPVATDDTWLEITDDSVTKKIVYGQYNSEEVPVIVKKGYRSSQLALGAYSVLEYIENTGTAYINTGYKLQSDKVRYELVFSQTSVSSSQSLFGAETGAPRHFTGVPYGTGGNLFIGQSEGLSWLGSNLDSTGKKMTFVLETDGKNKYTINYGDKTASGTYSSTLCKEYPIYLLNNNTRIGTQNCQAKVYSFKIYDNDVLARDMVPCMSPEGKVGMFDNVTETFFENAGGGSFVPGEALNGVFGAAGDSVVDLKWIANSYPVSFDWGDGTGSTLVSDKVFPNGLSAEYDSPFPELPQPHRYGYSFGGWYEGGEPFVVPALMDRDEEIALKASWLPVESKIVFDPAGGNIPESDGDIWTVNEDGSAWKTVEFDGFLGALPVPEKEGFKFLGWTMTSGYEQLEYIQSTSSGNQWIDTGYKLTSEKVRYELVFSQKNQTHGNQSLFGAETGGTRHFTGVPYGVSASLYIGTDNSKSSVSGGLNNSGEKSVYVLETDGKNGYTVTYRDYKISGTYSSTLCNSVNIALLNNGGATSQNCYATVYSFKIYDDDKLVRDLVPRREIGGAGRSGMFDKVTGNFYTSKSAAGFVAGPTLSGMYLAADDTFTEVSDVVATAVWEAE